MSYKLKVILVISASIVLIGLAVLVWANQTHRITIWGDTWTIGKWPEDQDNKIIEISLDGGDYVLTNSTTTYWKNGAVTKVSSVSSGPVKTDLTTCYTQSELNNLLTILDNAGFWQANSSYYGSAWGEGVWAIKNNIAKTVKLFPDFPHNTPANLLNAFSSVLNWPKDKEGRTFVNGVCNVPPVTTDTQAPTTPANFSAQAISSTQIYLWWDASTDNVGIDHYEIHNADNNNLIASTEDLSYVDVNLSPNTLHRYYIIAFDIAGNQSKQTPVNEVVTYSVSPTPTSTSTSTSTPTPTSTIIIPTPTATITNSATPTSGSTTGSTFSISKLVSTGQALWFNILIAIILSAIISYFALFRRNK